jgi:hypothetical protein
MDKCSSQSEAGEGAGPASLGPFPSLRALEAGRRGNAVRGVTGAGSRLGAAGSRVPAPLGRWLRAPAVRLSLRSAAALALAPLRLCACTLHLEYVF